MDEQQCPVCGDRLAMWSDGINDLLQCDDPHCAFMVTREHYPHLSRAVRLLAAVEGLEAAIHSYDQYDVVFWGGTAQFARIDRFNEVETKATGATCVDALIALAGQVKL